MKVNTTRDFRNPAVVRKAGLSALKKELGAVGAACFMRQFESGVGDYTVERDTLLQGVTLNEVIEGAQASEARLPKA